MQSSRLPRHVFHSIQCRSFSLSSCCEAPKAQNLLLKLASNPKNSQSSGFPPKISVGSIKGKSDKNPKKTVPPSKKTELFSSSPREPKKQGQRSARSTAKPPVPENVNRSRENFRKAPAPKPKKVTEEEKKYAKFVKSQEKQEQTQIAKKKERDDNLDDRRPHIALPRFVSLANLANYLKVKFTILQKKMQDMGFTELGHDNIIDGETAVLISDELGFEAVVNEEEGADLFPAPPPTDSSSVPLRPPIVTIMGHVDHGKTTILDYLRKSSVAAGEHGGITQHIGAFSVKLPSIKDKNRNTICFLDTPGHAAFLNMRQRGANVTDIVILVVAADDSVMPQTKEAIKHAQSAGVPIIVAVNKIDKEDANPDKVIADLAANGVDVETYGGDTQVVLVSGKTGKGIDELEGAILALSEMMDIRSAPGGAAEGYVIESHVKKGLGHVATVLVKRGTLKAGSAIVAGTKWCKVRMLKDDKGKTIKEALPGTPVEVLGWKELPEAGDEVLQAESESYAKKVVDNRLRREEQLNESKAIAEINEKRRLMRLEHEKEELRQERLKLGLPVDEQSLSVALGSEFQEVNSGPEKVNFIVKADVSGSAEAVQESIQGLGNDAIQANVLYSSVGAVTESDLNFAETSGATILAFNTNAPRDISNKANQRKVTITEYKVIYKLLEGVTDLLASKLPPELHHKVLAEASVRQVFEITMKKSKNLLVAGCRVTNGSLARNAKVRVLRNKKVVYDGILTSMKHHKEEVAEAKKDSECGLSFDGWDKFEEGDVVQTYEVLVVPRHL